MCGLCVWHVVKVITDFAKEFEEIKDLTCTVKLLALIPHLVASFDAWKARTWNYSYYDTVIIPILT